MIVKERIKTGILGSGAAARIHANALKDCPERELVGAYSPDTEGLKQFAAEYGVKAFESREALFQACECIHICTPSGMHFQDSCECLERGLHVMCEKPVCMTAEEGEQLMEVLEHAEGHFMPIAQCRYSDSYRKVQNALADGRLGELVGAQVEVMYYRSPEYYSGSCWRGNKKDDGGVMMNQAIHYIDMMVGLLGKPVSVTATAANRLHRIESPDTISALVEFESGMTTVMMLSTAASPGYPGRYTIYGTQGSLCVEENRIVEHGVQEAPSHTGFRDPGGISMELHAREFEEFSQVIHRGIDQTYTAREAIEAIRLIEAAFLAAEENRKVFLQ